MRPVTARCNGSRQATVTRCIEIVHKIVEMAPLSATWLIVCLAARLSRLSALRRARFNAAPPPCRFDYSEIELRPIVIQPRTIFDRYAAIRCARSPHRWLYLREGRERPVRITARFSVCNFFQIIFICRTWLRYRVLPRGLCYAAMCARVSPERHNSRFTKMPGLLLVMIRRRDDELHVSTSDTFRRLIVFKRL